MNDLKRILNKEFATHIILYFWGVVVCAGTIWMIVETVKSVIGG